MLPPMLHLVRGLLIATGALPQTSSRCGLPRSNAVAPQYKPLPQQMLLGLAPSLRERRHSVLAGYFEAPGAACCPYGGRPGQDVHLPPITMCFIALPGLPAMKVAPLCCLVSCTHLPARSTRPDWHGHARAGP